MTKTYFAELKEKLTKLDDVAANAYLTRYMEGGYEEPTYQQYGEYVHTKSAAIISELIEIIKLQSEALAELNEFTSSVLEDMEHYFDNKCVPTLDEVNQCAIADSLLRVCIGKTTTRLQKLRDGK